MIPPISQDQWLCATVYQEAAGESYMGKLGVAYVILNRAREQKKAISDVVLRGQHFSCWNHDSPTRLSLDVIAWATWDACVKACEAAMLQSEDDPTLGANHYLNEALTRKIRGGTLPTWFYEGKLTVRIGQHTFLKL